MEDIRSPVPQPISMIRVAEENGTASFAADTIALAPWIEGLSLGNPLLQAAPQIDHMSGGESDGIVVLESQGLRPSKLLTYFCWLLVVRDC